jgi:hypothetical protein
MPETTPFVRGIAEAQGVQQGHGPCPHGEDVAHDAAHAGRRTLIGLDEAGVVMALHLEDAGVAVVDVDDPGVLARPADDPRALGWKFAEVDLRRLVGAVLGPHHREDAQLDVVGLSPEPVEDNLVLIGSQAVFGGQFGHGLRGGVLGRGHGRAF